MEVESRALLALLSGSIVSTTAKGFVAIKRSGVDALVVETADHGSTVADFWSIRFKLLRYRSRCCLATAARTSANWHSFSLSLQPKPMRMNPLLLKSLPKKLGHRKMWSWLAVCRKSNMDGSRDKPSTALNQIGFRLFAIIFPRGGYTENARTSMIDSTYCRGVSDEKDEATVLQAEIMSSRIELLARLGALTGH